MSLCTSSATHVRSQDQPTHINYAGTTQTSIQGVFAVDDVQDERCMAVLEVEKSFNGGRQRVGRFGRSRDD